jgi:hypothetical protein
MTTNPETPFSCPACGTVHARRDPTYPKHVCHDCERETRCSHDRSVFGFIAEPSGGFGAFHADRGDNACEQVAADGRVWIHGVEYLMREARFGGVVTTARPDLLSVGDTLVWEDQTHASFTTDGTPRESFGWVEEVPGQRKVVRREPSAWRWEVRMSMPNNRVWRAGVARTREDAKNTTVAALDYLNVYYEAGA